MLNVVTLGRMKEFLMELNIGSIPFGEETEDIAFNIVLLCSADKEKFTELFEILGDEIENPVDSEEFVEEAITKLNYFFECMGEKFPKFLGIILAEKKQHADMVGQMMFQAMLPKLQEAMSSSTSPELLVKQVLEAFPKDLASQTSKK